MADIVQEAMMHIFEYFLKYSSWAKEQEGVLYNALKRISIVMAYKQYQDLRRRDYPFVHTRSHSPGSQGYLIIDEQVDPLEIDFDDALQERYFIRLVTEIATIPTEPRTALLVDLANHIHFNAHPTLLERAFLDVGIRLQDYQQLLPHGATECSRHIALLRSAYKRIMMKQLERLKEQNSTEGIDRSQGLILPLQDPEPDVFESDPKLTALAAHLDAIAPSAATDPAFRETLRAKLLGTLTEHYTSKTIEVAHENSLGTINGRDNGEVTDESQGLILPLQDPEPDVFESDPKLTALVAHLDAIAPSAATDPAFRETLRAKLLGILTEDHISEAIEATLDNPEEIAIDEVFPESLVIRLAHEIVDFPDEERTALLIDLVNRTHFNGELTLLERAFLDVGIRLQDYQQLLPSDPVEYRRYAFFLNLAYKRVVKLQEALYAHALSHEPGPGDPSISPS